jgi:hypothetical protein
VLTDLYRFVLTSSLPPGAEQTLALAWQCCVKANRTDFKKKFYEYTVEEI